MAALKLFISHSSRLDDSNDGARDNNENWALLDSLHDQFKAQNSCGVEIIPLVDKNISAGADWQKHLTLWLNECHVAIILFTDRALNDSAWVKKEATILLNRYEFVNENENENEKDFLLVPVFFEGENEPEDLCTESWKAIDILKANPIRNCPKRAQDIIERIISTEKFKQLADKLLSTDIPTPFLHIARDLQQYLVIPEVEAALKLAYEDLDHPDKMPDNNLDQNFAQKLTRFLLRSPQRCTEKLKLLTRETDNTSAREVLRDFYSAIRAIWIDTGSEADLSKCAKNNNILAINGNYLNEPSAIYKDNKNVRTQYFTIDCYIKRRWQKDRKGIFITTHSSNNARAIKEEIFNEVSNGNKNITEQEVVDEIRGFEYIVVYLKVEKPDETGISPEDIDEYQNLSIRFPNLVFILEKTGQTALTARSTKIQLIEPQTNIDTEKMAFNQVSFLDRALIEYKQKA
jgi:hypothetical protein